MCVYGFLFWIVKNFLQISFYWVWHGSQCSHNDRNSFCLYSPHPGYFSPLVRFFGCLMFFSPVRKYLNYLTPFFRIMLQDDIRFVIWQTSVDSVDLLIVRNCAWTVTGLLLLLFPIINKRIFVNFLPRFFCFWARTNKI